MRTERSPTLFKLEYTRRETIARARVRARACVFFFSYALFIYARERHALAFERPWFFFVLQTRGCDGHDVEQSGRVQQRERDELHDEEPRVEVDVCAVAPRLKLEQ